MGGREKILTQGKTKWKKIHARQLILKYSSYGLEKNSYKEFDDEKNSCGSKIPRPPPQNFSNVPSLIWGYWTNGLLLLDIPLLTWDEPWQEHGFEYDSFENQKEPQATKNKTNHLQVSLVSKTFTQNLHVRGKKLTASCVLACATQGLGPVSWKPC